MKTLNKLTVPFIQGGMGVGISMGNLAGAVASNGAMGVISTASIGFREKDFWTNTLAANSRALIQEINKAKDIANGKGLVAINAMVATSQFEEMVRLACDCQIDAVICGAGLPLSLPELTAGKDVMIAPIVSSGKACKTLLRFWKSHYNRLPDFIVVEGSRAGGHLGFSYEEASEGAAKPINEIVADVIAEAKNFDLHIPVFAAGDLLGEPELKKCKESGAYGVQIATPFIATLECDASQGYKDVIIKGSAKDVTILKSPVGMPGRGLLTPLIEKIGQGIRVPAKKCINCIKTCKPAETSFCINHALIEAFKGNLEEGLFFCGGGVEKIGKMTTVKSVIDILTEEWSK